MKKMALWSVVVFVGMMIFSSAAWSAAPMELSLNLLIPSTHARWVHVLEPWTKMVAEKSKGAVKITPYFANALSPTPEMYDATVNGLADITEGITYINTGRFPLTDMMMLPELGINTSLKAGQVLMHLYKTFPEVRNEFKGVKMLWLHSSPPMQISAKKPIRKVEDLKGLKMWVGGSVPAYAAKELGISPVSLSPGDVYVALDKGVIDAGCTDNEIFMSRRFNEINKYFTHLAFNQVPFYVIMNQQKWDKLPADIKKVFEEVTGDWAVDFTGKIRDEEDNHAMEAAKKSGVEYITLAPEEMDKWKKMVIPVQDKYAKDLDGKGMPGTKVLAEIRKLAASK